MKNAGELMLVRGSDRVAARTLSGDVGMRASRASTPGGVALLLFGMLPACKTSGKPPDPPMSHRPDQPVEFVRSRLPTSGEKKHTSTQAPAKDGNPSVSRDGRWLAFDSTANGAHYDIYVKPTDGVQVTRVTFDPADDILPRLSPDGKHVAYCSDRQGNWNIYVSDVEHPGATWQITMDPGDEICPSWNGDGTKLVYCAAPKRGEWGIWTVDLKTGARTSLGPGIFPDWSPVEDKIAFQLPKSRDAFWYGIWTIDTQGNKLTQIASSEFFDKGSWGAINPAWSPDGRWIAFATVHQSLSAVWEKRFSAGDDIWLVKADGSGITVRVTDSADPEWKPAWGGEGAAQRLFFVREHDGLENIWSVQPLLSPFPFEAPTPSR